MPRTDRTTTVTQEPDLRPDAPEQRTTDHGATRRGTPATTAASPPPVARHRVRRIVGRIGRRLIAAVRPGSSSVPPRPAREIAVEALRRADETLLGAPTTRPPGRR